MKPFHLLVLHTLFLLAVPVYATPFPSPLFGPHAVLQRDVPVVIWGKAEPGEKITVRFNANSAETVAEASGLWKVQLPALKGGERGDLIFEGHSSRIKSSDVIVGDVWVCAGQSNMERPVSLANRAADEIASSKDPDIRQFKIPTPQPGVPSGQLVGEWQCASPQTVGAFTAVGYFCARELRQVNQMPQGLINCTWGGTPIEAWLNPEVIANDPGFQIIAERWAKVVADYPAKKASYDVALAQWAERKKKAEVDKQSFAEKQPNAPAGAPLDRNTPSLIFNTMLRPVIPCSIRGFFWYQGEANWQYPREYEQILHAFIKNCRSLWENENLPFIVIQLPNYGGDGNVCWTELRRAQASIKTLPATGVVTTIDVGEPKEIHPTNKQDVGKRLALMVRHVVFGENIVYAGPEYREANSDGGKYTVKFDTHGSTLQIKDPPYSGISFEVAGVDRVFQPARAEVIGDTVIVTSEKVKEPVALRYCWRDGPGAILYNAEGLPAVPFRTDDWINGK